MNGSCGCDSATGPFSTGRDLVEFVYNAHGGALKDESIQGGGLKTTCQGCGATFTLKTFVGTCPICDGVHAISPPCSNDPANIQFAGTDFRLPR